jgi:LysR family transcriptional regulator, low CO2-responsive transcriptional regulator
MPIRDCTQRMTETLVCLKEQSSRRVVATFLEIVRESLREDQPEANSKNA